MRADAVTTELALLNDAHETNRWLRNRWLRLGVTEGVCFGLKVTARHDDLWRAMRWVFRLTIVLRLWAVIHNVQVAVH